MNFYSTYYKKQANYGQIVEIQEKFDSLDTNGDKALNKDELANIFTNDNMTQAEKDQILQGLDKDLLMQGLDDDNNGFITYLEFSPAYMEFDINKDASISGDEYDFAKKKISELEKQTQINDQYAILNDLTSTDAEKETAKEAIELFKSERNKIYIDIDINRKEILVSSKDAQIQEINNFINTNILLEFEEAKKQKEINDLEIEKNLLLMDKDVSVNKSDIENLNHQILLKNQEKNNAVTSAALEEINKDLAIYAQQKISLECQLETSEKTIEKYHRQVKIEDKEKILNKFFVPEFIKNQAREEVARLQDQQQLITQRMEMFQEFGNLSERRAELLELIYDYNQNPTSAKLQEITQKEEAKNTQQLRATLSSKKAELIDNQIQLKALMPKSDRPQFAQLTADHENTIASLDAEIAAIIAQLP